MPFIILKRDDIASGSLQVLDLQPNVSQRNLTLDTPGQTKYVNPAQNEALTLTGAGPITVRGDTRGLTAWFATNVNDGTGAFATGSFTVATGNVSDGDTATIDTTALGGPSVTFTFRAAPAASTDVAIGASEDDSAANLAAAINLAANGLNPYVSAAAPGGGPPSPVNLTAAQEGTASNSITLSTTGANLSDSGSLSGGADADSLTAPEATQDAVDVLGLLAFGDLATAAGALTLAAINGALTTGTITAAQLSDILDILAGREYFVPDGTQIDSDGTTFLVDPPVGSANGPRFITGTLRDIFDTSGLTLSVNTGHLSHLLDSGYTVDGVGGAQGEAVAVYNDDGTLF